MENISSMGLLFLFDFFSISSVFSMLVKAFYQQLITFCAISWQL